jgi:hypothetical protein
MQLSANIFKLPDGTVDVFEQLVALSVGRLSIVQISEAARDYNGGEVKTRSATRRARIFPTVAVSVPSHVASSRCGLA